MAHVGHTEEGITEMSLPKRVCKECGRRFILAQDKPGYANICPRCSATAPPLSNEDPKQVRMRKEMKRLGKLYGLTEGEINKMLDDQWLEDHGLKPSDSGNSK